MPGGAHVPHIAVSQGRIGNVAPRLVTANSRRHRWQQPNEPRPQAPTIDGVIGNCRSAIRSGNNLARGNRRYDLCGHVRVDSVIAPQAWHYSGIVVERVAS